MKKDWLAEAELGNSMQRARIASFQDGEDSWQENLWQEDGAEKVQKYAVACAVRFGGFATLGNR